MVVKKKEQLKDLIDKIVWVKNDTRHNTRGKLPDNKMVVGFYKKTKQENVFLVKIRLGQSVIAKLLWESGDKINLFVCEDKKHFLLVKSENAIGYTLSKEPGNTTSFKLQVRWTLDTPVELMPYKSVDFECHKHKLIFKM